MTSSPIAATRSGSHDTAELWAPVFKALGDPLRLQITLLLAQRPRSVKELQGDLRLSQTLVSHHLKMLRAQGVVEARPCGRSNVYQIRIDPLTCLAQCLIEMVGAAGSGCACPA